MLDWLRKTVVNGFIVNRNTLKTQRKVSSEDVFSKLAYRIAIKIKESSKNSPFSSSLLFEKGRIDNRGPYFFVQPWNEMGFLKETLEDGLFVGQKKLLMKVGF